MKKYKYISKIICSSLSFLLIWTSIYSSYAMSATHQKGLTLDDLKKRYPNAEFIHVSSEELQTALSRYQDRSVLVVPQGNKNIVMASRSTHLPYQMRTADKLQEQYPHALFQAQKLTAFQPESDLFENYVLLIAEPQIPLLDMDNMVHTLSEMKQHYPDTVFILYQIHNLQEFHKAQSQVSSPIVFMAHINRAEYEQQKSEMASRSPDRSDLPPIDVDISGSCTGDLPDLGDSDLAVVLFVLIGVFVVAALIVYAGKFIYDVATNAGKYTYWWELGPNLSVIENDHKHGFKEDGILAGLRIATGFTDRDVQVGLTGEFGMMDFNLYYEDKKGLLELEGFYGMVGPSIRFLFNKDMDDSNSSFLFLEILAGTSEHGEAGVLSTARIGVNWGIKDHGRIGLHFGTLYFDLKETESIIHEEDNFRLMGGMEIGYRF